MTMLIRQSILEATLFFRRKDAIFWTLAFPIFFMVLFGLIYGNTIETSMNMRHIDYLLPGIIVMGAMVTGVMLTASGFVGEREKGIYRRLALTPLTRQTLIGSQLLTWYFVIVVQTVLLIAIGVLAFKISITGNLFLDWLTLSFGALCFMSIGFALTGLIKTARSAQPINQMAFFILMFLGGVFFPIDMLPKFLQDFARVLPSTQMNDALRMVTFQNAGFGDIWLKLVVMAAWTLGCLLISVKFFRWE